MRDANSACFRWVGYSGYACWLVCTLIAAAFCAGCAKEVQPYEVRDLTRKGAPAKAMVQAQRAAICPIVEVRDCRFAWSSKKLYAFYTDKPCEAMAGGQQVILMKQGNHFVETTRAEGLPALRQIMQEYRFRQEDFKNREQLHEFFETVARLRSECRGCMLASSLFLERVQMEEGGIARWLGGKEKSEATFRDTCWDPKISYDQNNRWVASFNLFMPGGATESWMVGGVFDPRRQSNRIDWIRAAPLDEEGTFSYPGTENHKQRAEMPR